MDKSKRVYVGPVGFDSLTWQESLVVFEKLFEIPGQHQVAKANAEFVVTASRDSEVADILNKCSLVLPDGAGTLWGADTLTRKGFMKRFLFGFGSLLRAILGAGQVQSVIPERVGGADHVVDECRLSAKLNKGIFLLGASDESRERAKKKLEELIPGVDIAGQAGSSSPFEDSERLISAVNKSGAEFLIVCFGHPLQERWIATNLPKMPKIKIADGEGGAFDFLAGVQKRSPELLQKIGFEGFYRFLRNPVRRFKKLWISYPVFIWMILTQKQP